MSDELAARLLRRSALVPETGCRRWQGAHQPKGYGQISVDGRARSVHVVAHELWIGPVPDDHDVDHVHARGCRYRDCIEPEHLEAVTRSENAHRMLALRTHCTKGHELTPDNVKHCRTRNNYTARKCRRCFNDQRNAWRARNRA